MKMYENKIFKRDAYIKVTRETRATAEETLNVQLNPLGQQNNFVAMNTPYNNQIFSTGMISDPINSLGTYNFQQSAVITKETAGRLIFRVINTLPLTRTLENGTTVNPDTWQIRVNVIVPVKLKPRVSYEIPN